MVSVDPIQQSVTIHAPVTASAKYATVGRKNISPGADERTFYFDSSIWSADPSDDHFAGQESLWEIVGHPYLEHSLQGYNCCILAYGQTGAGKTYSMMGTAKEPGLIPRVSSGLFREIESFSNQYDTATVHVSYFEIYNENVRDLLAPSTSNERPNLKVREDPKTGPYVEGLSTFQVKTFADIEAFMKMGNSARVTASTAMNNSSSRSHAVFTITTRRFSQTQEGEAKEKTSQFRLVDLAGSERASSTGASGVRLREGGNINKSLTTLGRVIAALSEQTSKDTENRPPSRGVNGGGGGGGGNGKRTGEPIIPYRDSVLTFLLKDSLGGNSKTAMIACISPADYEESLSTLRYADAAKKIRMTAIVNETENISEREMALLRTQLAEMNSKIEQKEQYEGFLVTDLQAYREKISKLDKLVRVTQKESGMQSFHAIFYLYFSSFLFVFFICICIFLF